MDRGVVDSVRRFGILSTFPPTACGIATFSAALAAGLVADGATVDVVRCGAAEQIEDPLVVASMGGGRDGVLAAADALNNTDVAIIQHEYGIFGGVDGADVLDVLDALVVPSVVVAHTVVRRPTPHQRMVLERLCDAADAVVVMTDYARQRLIADFDVDADRVSVIPHGATTPTVDAGAAADVRPAGSGMRLLTWGLLGPGKGIEWAVDAMALLDDVRPRPSYLIAGATHPNVRRDDGEAYRDMLVRRSRASAAAGTVSFDDSYRDLPALTRLIGSADLVVLPYDSDDQVTSGVLVDAVAFGCPVVATAFPHAIELLGGGAGIVVPQRDAAALADAVRGLVEHPNRLAAMAAECRRLAPELSWPAVARRYDELAGSLLLAAGVGT